MTDDFERELHWAGWRAMAAAAFNLAPVDAHALALLRRRAGQTVPMGAFAAFEGQAEKSHGQPGSPEGVRSRIQRTRLRIRDVGCGDVIETVRDGPFSPCRGYRMSRAGAERIDLALRCACGLEPRLAA